jgi:capsular polysaccharide biosynthesis protein
MAEATGEWFEFSDPVQFEFTEPRTVGEQLPSIRERCGIYGVSQPFVATIPDVKLVGTYPIAVKNGGVLVEPTVSTPVTQLNIMYTIKDFLTGASRPTGTIDLEEACLLFNTWSSGYFHWVFESLPRLEGIEEYERRHGRRPTLILPSDPTSFQIESLELLGYTVNDWVTWDSWSGNVERLVIPSNRRKSGGKPSPIDIRWLRQTMRSAVDIGDTEATESSRVYISRKDADRRQVVNEDEVFGWLQRHGFDRFQLSERSLVDNIKLFANAEIIVGPHGAGLTDILYSEDATVVEFHRGDASTKVYYDLSQQLDLDYRYLVCDSKSGDIVVDVKDLKQLLGDIV